MLYHQSKRKVREMQRMQISVSGGFNFIFKGAYSNDDDQIMIK